MGQSLVPVPEEQHLPSPETAATAVAASAKATIEARYLVALRNPRDWDNVRVKLLAACERPRFAEVARYSKPVGGKSIVGPSIRFAEEAIRQMGNILVQTTVTYESAEQRVISVAVTDLEANVAYPMDVVLKKIVERSSVRSGQTVVGTRTNTSGNRVYLVEATEDEFLTKQNAALSKALRQGALRILPSDILEEAMEVVAEVVATRDAQDPTAARKRIVDAFFTLGVMPSQLQEFLGHAIDGSTPAEMTLLRTMFTAMKEGEATWTDVMETRKPKKAEGDEATPANAALKARLEKQAKKAKAKAMEQAKPETSAEPVVVAEENPPVATPSDDDLALDRTLAEEAQHD